MAIKINWYDISARKINGFDVSKVMLNRVQIRPEENSNGYLSMTWLEEGSKFRIRQRRWLYNSNYEFSYDTITWGTPWTDFPVLENNWISLDNWTVYIRYKYDWYSEGYTSFEMEWIIAADWDIWYLLSKNSTDTIRTNALKSVFEYCTSLVTAPYFPATNLYGWCYSYAFNGCSNLTTVHDFPSVTFLRENEYDLCWGSFECMFFECTSLVTAPRLPTTDFIQDYTGEYPDYYNEAVYGQMFEWCTSLRNAPALPATVLSRNCYYEMFSRCSSLVTAPRLPALSVLYGSYNNMFSYCTSLINAPALPATTLSDYCYSWMFYNCTSLESIPSLPATTLANYCYQGMFSNCSSLMVNQFRTTLQQTEYRIPTVWDITPSVTDPVDGMFIGTGGEFNWTPSFNTIYYIGTPRIMPVGSYWNPSLWLISWTTDWIHWNTMADKNVWATQVWHVGDAFTDSNVGCCYQWGNNYGFPYSWATNTSPDKVDASSYWPSQYSSNVFITQADWDSSRNTELWRDGVWPCPAWFHIWGFPSYITTWGLEAFLCPWGSGFLSYGDGQVTQVNSQTWFWSNHRESSSGWGRDYADYTYINVWGSSIYYNFTYSNPWTWYNIRPRKDVFVIPDSSRTVLYQA